MKKKILNSIVAFSCILTGTLCLTACGGDNFPGVDIFGNTFTFSEEATFSAKINMNNDSVSDWEQWIKDNWNSSYSFGDTRLDTKKTSAEDLIFYIKSEDFMTNISDFNLLKGAVVEIGAGTSTGSDNEKKGDFKVSWGQNESINTFIISTSESIDYPLYYNGKIEGNGYFGYGFDFELNDFNYKYGTMNGASFRFFSGDDNSRTTYSNAYEVTLTFGAPEETQKDITITKSYDCMSIKAK